MNIPSEQPHTSEDVNKLVQEYVKYLSENPYGAVEAEIHGAPCTVIAAVESEAMEQVQPMFIIPSPELIMNVVDMDDKQPIFAIVTNHLN